MMFNKLALAALFTMVSSFGQADAVTGSGTGFFINTEGYGVTNAHVVKGCTRVAFAEGGDATDIKLDVENDLAILRSPKAAATYLKLRRNSARLGEDIAAFGYPLGTVLSSSVKVTTGNINSLMGLGDDTRYLQVSTPIQPGNSGGPVVDRAGRLLGITTATLKPEAGGGSLPQNVNFALRSRTLEAFLESRGVAFEFAADEASDLSTADLAEQVQAAVFSLRCFGPEVADAPRVDSEVVNAPAPQPYRLARHFNSLDGHDVVGFDFATVRMCRKLSASAHAAMTYDAEHPPSTSLHDSAS